MHPFRLLTILLFVAFTPEAFGTHLLGGEIRYIHLSGITYSIEVVTWCDLYAPADRPEIMIDFGDGVVDTIPRTSITDDPVGGICGGLRLNAYTTTHTYSGPGTYIIRHTDQNRNGGIVNIPNSVNHPFSVSARLVIDPVPGANNSVVFNSPSTEHIWNWSTLIHDPLASDADGDSLSFQLVLPEGLNGAPIIDYGFPDQITSPGGFAWCDPTSGVFLWDHPFLIGEYVIAIRCDEWRDGVLVGQVTRDMTICVSTLPTAIPGGSTSTEDMRILRVNDEWMLENNTQGMLIGELMDARGALVQRVNFASGQTIVPLTDQASGLILLRATDSEGHQRTFKLTP